MALKPCPFCGDIILGITTSWFKGGYTGYVYCKMCRVSGPLKKTQRAAVRAWNKRVFEDNDNGKEEV